MIKCINSECGEEADYIINGQSVCKKHLMSAEKL